ncbi:Ribosome-recycling factor [Trichinella pseudospiralis]
MSLEFTPRSRTFWESKSHFLTKESRKDCKQMFLAYLTELQENSKNATEYDRTRLRNCPLPLEKDPTSKGRGSISSTNGPQTFIGGITESVLLAGKDIESRRGRFITSTQHEDIPGPSQKKVCQQRSSRPLA